jgi:hypothetical protein
MNNFLICKNGKAIDFNNLFDKWTLSLNGEKKVGEFLFRLLVEFVKC